MMEPRIGLLLLPLLAAFAHAQHIKCPGEIFYAHSSSAEMAEREWYARKPADSLDHCVRLCYGNQFCFSATFWTIAPEGLEDDRRCRLSYVSSYGCNARRLVAKAQHTGPHTTVECLRCPANGELEEEVALPVEKMSEEVRGSSEQVELPSAKLIDTTTQKATTDSPSSSTAQSSAATTTASHNSSEEIDESAEAGLSSNALFGRRDAALGFKLDALDELSPQHVFKQSLSVEVLPKMDGEAESVDVSSTAQIPSASAEETANATASSSSTAAPSNATDANTTSTTTGYPFTTQPPTSSTPEASTSTTADPTTSQDPTTAEPTTLAPTTPDAATTTSEEPTSTSQEPTTTATDEPTTTTQEATTSTEAPTTTSEAEVEDPKAKPTLAEGDFLLVVKNDQELPIACPSGASAESAGGGRRECAATRDCARRSRCHQPSPTAQGICCHVVPSPSRCTPLHREFLADCRRRYFPSAQPNVTAILGRDPFTELSLEAECSARLAYAACRDSSSAECSDVEGDLGEYLCLPETRLMLRATRLCRSEPVFQQPLTKCLDNFTDDCEGAVYLGDCIARAAVDACQSPELADILQALVNIHVRGGHRECEEDARPASIPPPTQPPASNLTETLDQERGASSSLLSTLIARQNCSAEQEAGLSACLQTEFAEYGLGVGLDLSLLSNASATEAACTAFQAYDACTTRVMAADPCQSYFDRLLKDMMRVVCSEDGRSALSESSACLSSGHFAARMDACAVGFSSLDLGGLTELSAVCRELANLTVCAVATSEELCGARLAGLVGQVLLRTKEAHFGHGCEGEVAEEESSVERGPCGSLVFSGSVPSSKVEFEDKAAAASPTECAQICWRRRCTLAGFNPPSINTSLTTMGVCLLSFVPQDRMCADRPRVPSMGASEPLLVECLMCGDGTALAIEPPPQELTQKPLTKPGPTTPAPTTKSAPTTLVPTTEGATSTTSTTEEANTSTSTEEPTTTAASTTSAQVSTMAADEPTSTTTTATAAPTTSTGEPTSTIKETVGTSQSTAAAATEPTSTQISTSPLTVSTTPESPRPLSASRQCPVGRLSFVGVTLSGPEVAGGPSPKVPLFASQAAANTSEDCAAQCFADPACTGAGYNPPLRPGLDGVCLFSFEERSERTCDLLGRLYFFRPTSPALLLCIRCDQLITTVQSSTDQTPTTVSRKGIRIVTETAAASAEPSSTPEPSTTRTINVRPRFGGLDAAVAFTIGAPKIAIMSSSTTQKPPTEAPVPTTALPETSPTTTVDASSSAPTTAEPLNTTSAAADATTLAAITEALNSSTASSSPSTSAPSPSSTGPAPEETAAPVTSEEAESVEFSQDDAAPSLPVAKAPEEKASGIQLHNTACRKGTKVSFKPLAIAADSELFKVAFVRSKGSEEGRVFTHVEEASSSAMACARLCRHKGCTIAAFRPLGVLSGECVLSFKTVQLPCPATKRVTSFTPASPVLLMCLECVAVEDPGAGLDQVPPPPFRSCAEGEAVAFLATELSPSLPVPLPQFSVRLMAGSEEECAVYCYQRGCTSAGFYPNGEAEQGLCLMSMERRHPSVALCAQHDERFQTWSLAKPSLLLCLGCEVYKAKTEDSVASTTPSSKPSTGRTPTKLITAATVEPLLTTASSPSMVLASELFSGKYVTKLSTALPESVVSCSGDALFSVQPIDASEDVEVPAFSYVARASSAAVCARMCLLHNCTLAAFKPRKDFGGLVEESVCLLAVDEDMDMECGEEPLSSYTTTAEILIHCVKCGETRLPVLRPKAISVVKSSEAIRSSEEASESKPSPKPTTLKPGFVSCFNCVAVNKGACDANSCQGTFCLVQAIRDPVAGLKVAQSCSIAPAPEADGCSQHHSGETHNTVCVCRDAFCNSGARIAQALGWDNLTAPAVVTARPIARNRLDPSVGLTDFQPSRGSAARLPQSQIPECKAGIIFRTRAAGDSETVVRDSGFVPTYRLRKNTPQACAEICYYTGCASAHFSPSEKLCMLSYQKSRNEVADECDGEQGGFVRQFAGPAIFLRCVICAQPIDNLIRTTTTTSTTTPKPQPRLPVIRPAIVELEDLDIDFGTRFLGTTTPQPEPKDIGAPPSRQPNLGNLPSLPSLPSRVIPSSSSRPIAPSSSRPFSSTSRGLPSSSTRPIISTSRPLRPSSTRALPSSSQSIPVTTRPFVSTSTTRRPLVTRVVPPALRGLPAKAAPAPPKEEREDRNCVVSFQAATGQDTTRVVFENSTSVDNPTDCARACYRQGCTIAEYIPPPAGPYRNLQQLGACYLGFQEAEACDGSAKRRFSFESADVVDMTCVRCVRVSLGGDEGVSLGGARTVAERRDELPSFSSEILLSAETAAAAGGGCEPTFEVLSAKDSIAALGVQFFHRVEGETSSVAACAGLCLQRPDCRLAGYDPPSKLCMFGRPVPGKETQCGALPRLAQFAPKTQVIIQCLRCGFAGSLTSKPQSTSAFGSMEQLPSLPLPPPSRECEGAVSFELGKIDLGSPLAIRHVSRDVRHAGDCARLCYGLSGCKVAGWEPSTGECFAYFGELGGPPCSAIGRRVTEYLQAPPVWLQCLRCDAPAFSEVAARIRQVEEVRKTGEVRFIGERTAASSYVAKRNCSGASFQKRVLAGGLRPSEYQRTLSLPSAQACARACFELECTNAAFDPPGRRCHLSFDFEICQAAVGRVMTHGTDQPIAIQCIKCIDASLPSSLRSIDASVRVMDSVSGTGSVRGLRLDVRPGAACPGRLVFQTRGVREVPRLNVTNDVAAASPADCARKCWESDCQAAGYIPNPARAGGVCLLSRDPAMCSAGASLVPQVSESSPVLISCLRCSGCDYRVRQGLAPASLPDFNVQTSARDVSDCAAECGRRRCVAAAFSGRSSGGNCLLALSGPLASCAASERLAEALPAQPSTAPLILDCLTCPAF